jgi:hypothetical protein
LDLIPLEFTPGEKKISVTITTLAAPPNLDKAKLLDGTKALLEPD